MFLLLTVGMSAIVMAQTIMPLSGTNGAAAINDGVSHYNQGKWNDASSHFQKALKKNPRSAVAHYNLALAYNQMGQREKAAHHFQKASKLGQMNSFIRNSMILKQYVPSGKGTK